MGLEDGDDGEWIAEAMKDIEAEIFKKTKITENNTYLGRDERTVGKWTFEYYDRDYKNWNSFCVYLVSIAGYYEGVMYDINTDEVPDNIPKRCQKEMDKEIRKLEKILKERTMIIRRVAVLNNGEGIYEKIK
jgi:hypothetical protein